MKYDDKFFDYVDSGAIQSADVIVSWLYRSLKPTSVLDVGCGRGGWLKKWQDEGCRSVTGVDGDYVDVSSLYIAHADFQPINISKKFSLGRRFDLVQCLEVAEHVEPNSSETLIDNIVDHGDIVLFSAALPGQGGTQHINERSLNYWRGLFSARGYMPYDCIRPKFSSDVRIEPWYRYNSVVYANKHGSSRLPSDIASSIVSNSGTFKAVEPLTWRVRRAAFRFVPVGIVDQVAVLNAKVRQIRNAKLRSRV